MKEQLIKNGIKNLKEFGYDKVNEENIFTDLIYSQMFKSMLEDNLGYGIVIDENINELLSKIKTDKQ